MPKSAMERSFAQIQVAAKAAELPDVTEGTSYGTPSLKVRGKSFARLKDAETLVLMCPLEEKELLLAAAPEIFFETDHYKGWPAILVRLSKIEKRELQHRLANACRFYASNRQVKAYDAQRTSSSASRTRVTSPSEL